ncbi:MAG TPA: hypothetical protein VFN09_06655 [Rhodanobacteraceae bacterium]|nr:hypothetical protein [Rhodanobacteraceae bacterium]
MAAALTPGMYEELAAVARAAQAAGHGGKTAVYQAAAARLGMSLPTLLGRLKQVRHGAPRKQRSDAGSGTLSNKEALALAATMTETRRLTDTGTLALERALDTLRRGNALFAARVDTDTGEIKPLSVSAVRRALVLHNCHPGQLAQPTAAISIASEHPNHLWQTDASVSRQYYMAPSGTEVMDASVYYRGKPANFFKINERRLIRYVNVDHCSGHVRLFYVQGSESGMNVVSAMIHAMTPVEGIAMHGVPRLWWMDKGSLSALVENFAAALDMEVWAHAAGNPRALGSAEGMHRLVEQTFEAPLKLRKPVCSVAEMNALADDWCRWFCATRMHTRTGLTRRDGWLRITPAQLREAPAPAVLRQLAVSAPTRCTVRDLSIKYKSALWDVRALPGVLEGGKLDVVTNAYDTDTVRVLVVGADGKPAHFLAPRVGHNEWGFRTDAALAGAEFRAMPETAADANRREIERLVMRAETDAEAKAKRKAKTVAFDGALDPTRPWRETPIAPHLPRAAAPAPAVAAPAIIEPTPVVPLARPVYVPQPLTHVEMARALKRRVEQLGGGWSAEMYARMAELWPDGVPEEQLDACATQLLRGGLRAVAGGAA